MRIIDTFADQFKWHRYLVTCRIYAYIGQPYQLGGFQQTTLMPFNEEQIQSFISAWYRELEHRSRFTESESNSKAAKLKDAAVKPDLIGLAERPLLLTVMSLLHSFRGELPEDRVELYQKTVELLMERWERRYSNEKGILEALETPGLKMRNLYSGFYAAAFDAYSQSKNNQDNGEIKEGDLRQHFAQLFNDDWNKAGKFVDYIRDRAYAGLYTIARRKNVPVIPVYSWRDDNMRHHHIKVLPAVELCHEHGGSEERLLYNTQKFMDLFEKMMMTHPDQWIWMHRRWKIPGNHM